jgi:hypothetical protein
MQIEVKKCDPPHRSLHACDRSDPHRAVAAQQENHPVGLRERIGHATRRRLHGLDDRV